MSEDLWGIGYGGIDAKDGTYIGDTTNLPANWQAFQDNLWQTISFQRNYNPLVTPTSSQALGMALAVMCADVKARDLAKSEMELWRKVGRSYREVEPSQHWFAKKLSRRPNPYMTWTEFWRMTVFHLSLAQNAYVYKEINRLGEIVDLYPMPPARTARFTGNGRVWYEFAANTDLEKVRMDGADRIVLPADRVIHFMGRTSDGISGISNLTLGAPLFELVNSIGRFQTQLFNNDGRQPIVFESDSAVFGTGDQADQAFRRLKQQLTEAVRKMNAYGEPILLEAGYKAKIIAQNARDAMTTDAFQKTVVSLCGLLEVPPHKVFAYETVKYDNMAAADNQYANDCLVPMAKNMEEKLRLELLQDDEVDYLFPEFDRMPLLAGDAKTLMEVVDKGMSKGLMTFNEGRERLPLGLNPVKGGDKRMVPVNMALVDEQGEIVAIAANGQPNNDGQTPAPVDAEQATRALADAVRKGLDEASKRSATSVDVAGTMREFGQTIVEAIKSSPQPQITIPVTVNADHKDGPKETVVKEHYPDGRIKRFVQTPIEE
jgi:HK97 family phage portal protein